MKESKFTELVNSYFDREITVAELESLRREIAENPERRRDFEVRYRLHKAMCAALSNDDLGPLQSGSSIAQRIEQKNVSNWFFGLGMAALFILSFAFSASLFRESNREFQLSDENSLSKSDIERNMENQAVREQSRGGLASQLRLMGLTPDIVPLKPRLSEVDVESLRQLEIRRQQAIDRINQYKAYSAFSKLRSNESLQYSSSVRNDQLLPPGFQSTLASF